MAINSRDLMLLAESLWKNNNEAYKRSAVSRAYYAAYHEAKAWHKNLPEPGSIANSKGGSHDVLIHQLANPMGKTKKDTNLANDSVKISSRLESLRSIRNAADYDISDNFDADEHFGLMIEVKQFLRDLGVQFAPVTSPSLAPTMPAPSRTP